jgi:hypothetical protein
MVEAIKDENKGPENIDDDSDFNIDFTTSSAINRVSLKFLIVYIPIFWFSGLIVATFWYGYTQGTEPWIIKLLFLPILLLAFTFLFIISCFFFSNIPN